MKMTAFRQRFQEKYGKCPVKQTNYSLKNIKKQSPEVYSADEVMLEDSGKLCDSFVLCVCAQDTIGAPETTGIYVVEEKGKYPPIKTVQEQLQSGADFICNLLEEEDKFEFLPVLVAKGIFPSRRSELAKVKIELRDKIERIAHVKPKAPLKRIC